MMRRQYSVAILSLMVSACGGGGESKGGEEASTGGYSGHAGELAGAGSGGETGGANASGGVPQVGQGGESGSAGRGGDNEGGFVGTSPSGGGGSTGSGGTGRGGTGGSGSGSGGSAGSGGTVGTLPPPPSSGLSPEQETAVISQLKSVQGLTVSGRREGGYVVELHLWTSNQSTPVLTDRDLARIDGFNRLRRLELNNPKISLEGAQVIRRLPGLTRLGFQYVGRGGVTLANHYMLVADSHQSRLQSLSFKHLFGYAGTSIHKLGTYPNLKYMVVDNESAQAEMVTFFKKNPSIVVLEIHRTRIDGATLRAVAEALPQLQCLHLKTDGGALDSSDVQNAFKDHPALKVLWPHGVAVSGLTGVRIVSGFSGASGFGELCPDTDLRPSDAPLNPL